MLCYRAKNTFNFYYIIDNFPLPEINTVRDLGITFQANLMCSTLINQIGLKAIVRTLGFLIRSILSFKDK